VSGPLGFDPDEQARRPPEPEPEPEPEREPPQGPPPARPVNTSRYTWIIGIAAVILLGLVTVNAVTGEGTRPGGPEAGDELPVFAAPLAEAAPREDGNEDAQVDPSKACGVRGPGVVNMCDERDAGPVVFAIFPADAPRCRDVLDQFDRVAPRVRGVRFVAAGSRGKRSQLGTGHPYPVAWDRDGGLATAYGLVGCPQVTFAERGGRVVETTRTELSDAELAEKARALVR
jgi:hypothetical protein